MKTLHALALLPVLLAPGLLAGQTIGGQVVEDSTKVVIQGAIVSVMRPGGALVGTVRTDSVGHFALELDSAGTVLLRVTHPSYRTVLSDTIEVDENEAITVELRLARQAIPIAPLEVVARVDRRLQGFRERVARGYAFGRFITREQIERRPGMSATELLSGIAGIRLVSIPPCHGCAGENIIFMRGGTDRCMATVLIDGLEVKQAVGFPIDASLQPETLEGVEVYPDPSGIPPQLGIFSSQCGLVAFWTKTPEGGKLTWKKIAVAVGILGILLVVFH